MSTNEYSTKPPTAPETKVFLEQVDEALFLGAGSLAKLGMSDSMTLWLESLSEAQTMLLRRVKGRCSSNEVAECAADVIVVCIQWPCASELTRPSMRSAGRPRGSASFSGGLRHECS